MSKPLLTEGALAIGSIIHAGQLVDVNEAILTYAPPDPRKQHVTVSILRCVMMKAHYMKDPARERADIIQNIDQQTRLWMALDHPNIMPVLGAGLGDEPCIINPASRAVSLTLSRLIQAKPDTSRRLEILKQAADGLAYLHTQPSPVVHGSLNPDHIYMVGKDGRAMISDFGLSALCESIVDGLNLTLTHHQTGLQTHYLPAHEILDPAEEEEEDASSSDSADRRTVASDVHDFGSLMLEVLSGRRPYEGMAQAKAILSALKGVLPEPTAHPIAGMAEDDLVWDLMRQCWAMDPAERPTMIAVAEQLGERRVQFLREQSVSAEQCARRYLA